jgi:hypothetical protein
MSTTGYPLTAIQSHQKDHPQPRLAHARVKIRMCTGIHNYQQMAWTSADQPTCLIPNKTLGSTLRFIMLAEFLICIYALAILRRYPLLTLILNPKP